MILFFLLYIENLCFIMLIIFACSLNYIIMDSKYKIRLVLGYIYLVKKIRQKSIDKRSLSDLNFIEKLLKI